MAEAFPSKRTNKRLVLTGYGGINKIKLQRKELSNVKNGHVLIKVEACSINNHDILARQGLNLSMTIRPPCVLGMEVAGTIDECGQGVSSFEVGDRVIGIAWSGGWSEYVSVALGWVFSMPNGMTFEEAAAIPISYLTAYFLLFEYGGLKEGKSILCHQAFDDVGLAVGQLCKTVPHVTLYGTCPHSWQSITRKHGYDYLVDSKSRDYVTDIRQFAPNGVDIVLDPYRGVDNRKNYFLTKRLGKHIMYGGANLRSAESRTWFGAARQWWNTFHQDLSTLIADCKMIGGVVLTHLVQDASGINWVRTAMHDILKLYSEGVVRPRIDAMYPLEEFNIAMERIHSQRFIGKVILLPTRMPGRIEIIDPDLQQKEIPSSKFQQEDTRTSKEEELVKAKSREQSDESSGSDTKEICQTPTLSKVEGLFSGHETIVLDDN